MRFVIRTRAIGKIFDHPFVEGDPFSEADFQSGIPKMVLSEQVATDLFGTGQAVGQQVGDGFYHFHRLRGGA